MFRRILQMKNVESGFRRASLVVRFWIRRTKMGRMKQVHLRFYEELNDYLPEHRRKRIFVCRFAGEVTVGMLLKAVGIPSSAVDLVLCRGESAGFDQVVEDGCRLAVYPVFESLDLKGTTLLRDEPLRRPAFIAGPGLARLAVYLRLLGFDTCSCGDFTGRESVSRVAPFNRILLTLDSPPPGSGHAFQVREVRPRHQVLQVVAALDLRRRIKPFGRCPRCNSELGGSGTHTRPCRVCGASYHEGPHLQRVQRLLSHLSSASSLTSGFQRP